jgi:hypothetical protein
MNKVLIISVTIFSLVLVELGLRYSNKLKTYSEQNFDSYSSAYSSEGLKHLYVWNPNDTTEIEQIEFSFTYETNEYGLVKTKQSSALDTIEKIIFLGDSFVFGIGASPDSSLPVFLSEKLHIPIVNAGIPGSDPFFEEKLIDSIFLSKLYNKYLIMVNCSDLYDYIFRGGEERFLPNNQVEYHKAPELEKYYKNSYLLRAIVHGILKMDYSLLSKEKAIALKFEAVEVYTALLLKIAKQKNLIVVIQPYARQYSDNNSVMKETLNYSYLNLLESKLIKNSVRTINLDKHLKNRINKNNYLNYSWNIDGHYNAKGYALLSEILAEELTLKYPEFINAKE